MDWLTFIKYACSLSGMVCLGFTYILMYKSSRKKAKKLKLVEKPKQL
ncbi:hypothetical protein [Sutcliffiella deserti]|nr:hypothetical protein [Sutcliffiella deserti]